MARRGYGQSPFSNYDSWKTTDPRDGADGSLDHVKCAYWYELSEMVREGTQYCNVPYEDHDDEELGHEFVQPEIGSRE